MNDNHARAYGEGWNAYFDGKGSDNCPYAKFSSDYVSWEDGWYEAGTCERFGDHRNTFGVDQTDDF